MRKKAVGFLPTAEKALSFVKVCLSRLPAQSTTVGWSRRLAHNGFNRLGFRAGWLQPTAQAFRLRQHRLLAHCGQTAVSLPKGRVPYSPLCWMITQRQGGCQRRIPLPP